VTNVTGENGETKAEFGTPQAIHHEPSRVERLLSSVFLYAGLSLTAAVAAAGGWAVWNSAPPKPAPVVTEKPPPLPPVVVEKPSPSPPVVVEKPPPPPLPSEPEHQTPADHPVASEAENPPGDPAVRALLDRGRALVTPPYSAFRWQQAHEDFEKALGLDADSNEARIGLAYVLGGKLSDEWSPVLQEDPRRAEQLLVEVLDRGDTANRMAAAHFELGLVHQMQNRLAKAQREFRLSIALEPNNPRAHLHLGEALLYLGDPECALFEQAVRFSSDGDPILPINYWALGTCHMLIGETDKAIVLLQKARAANDHIWVPYFYLAGAYGLKGDLDNAKSALAESLKLKPAMKSLARMRGENPWLRNPQYSEMQEKTLNLGLRQIGFPDQ
jgi:tetratricopeptide (TPR) repeat protein